MIPKEYEENFTDFEPLTISPEERAVLEDLHRRSCARGIEFGQGRTSEGFSRVFTSEDPNGVHIPADILTASGLHLYHAHTNATPLSGDDFKLLTRENVERITVITENGDVFSAWIGDGERPSADAFQAFLGWIRIEVDSDIPQWPESFSWSPEELSYMSIREQAYRIARHFKWHLEGGKL